MNPDNLQCVADWSCMASPPRTPLGRLRGRCRFDPDHARLFIAFARSERVDALWVHAVWWVATRSLSSSHGLKVACCVSTGTDGHRSSHLHKRAAGRDSHLHLQGECVRMWETRRVVLAAHMGA
ncbi:hypothetical protein AOLI_G00029230 [Acnodon oligacanthus]